MKNYQKLYIRAMKFLHFILISVLLCTSISSLKGQVSLKDSSIKLVLVDVHYGAYAPAGDLNERFGFNSTIGLSVALKLPSNWLFGVEGNFLFGSNVKENDLFVNIDSQDGGIIGSDGKYADVKTYERGFLFMFNCGKLIPVKKPNPNSGIILMAGAGLLQHKIRIEVAGNTVPYLDKEYRKGYDRLSNGLALHQFAGYQYLSNKGLVNFYAGIDLYQGFTQNRRSYNYDEQLKDNTKRTDLLFGLRVGWILPLYKKAADEYYIY